MAVKESSKLASAVFATISPRGDLGHAVYRVGDERCVKGQKNHYVLRQSIIPASVKAILKK